MHSAHFLLIVTTASFAVSACVGPQAKNPTSAIQSTRTTGGPPIPASGPCPAPTFGWRIKVHIGPGIDDRPLFTVIGKIRLKHRQWAELREEYPLTPTDTPIYLVRLNVRMSPTGQPDGDRVIELKNTQPVASRPGAVVVRCGSHVVARFASVSWAE